MATSQLLSSTGTAWEGIYTDLLEHVPALHWPTSVRTYAEMRTDPKIAAVLAAYTLPLRRSTWAVDGSGCRPEVTELVASGLDLPILGQDRTPNGARRRGVRWAQHLRMALLHLVFGHMPFELEADDDGTRTRLVGLHERMPQTIAEIQTNRDGSLKGVVQDVGVIVNTPIAADRLAWYVHEREGAAWQGRSLLRAAYAPWLIKHEMQRVHATSNRRFGMGVPGFEAQPGSNPTPAQLLEAQRLASAVRVGDKGGMAAPPGFTFVLKGLTGSVPDTLAFIRYLDQQMSGMALTGVLDLGDTPNGSRALGETFVDLLLLSLQAIAEDVADVTTADVATRIVDWNWGETEPVPSVVCADVGASHEITAETLQALLTSGALAADPALEEFVRRQWKLPERTGPMPAPVPLQVAAGAIPRANRILDKLARDVGVAAAAGLRRQPTAVEAAAKTDFEQVQATWESALDQLIEQWGNISAAQREQLVDQVLAAVDAGDVEALAALSVDSQAAAELLAVAMREVADAAATQAVSEASEQGVDVAADDVDVDGARLDQVAAAMAALMATGLAGSAARKALQAWGPGSTPSGVAAAVLAHLTSLTDASLRDNLGGALTTAQNGGRLAALATAPEATYFSSEILDANTCEACQGVDGQRFDDLAAAEEAYPGGGFRDCQGGLRCRGIVVAVWDDAALEDAA